MKRNGKNFSILVICFILLVLITGCGKSNENKKDYTNDIISVIKDNMSESWTYEESKVNIDSDYNVTIRLNNVNHWYQCGINSQIFAKKMASDNSEANNEIKSLTYTCYDFDGNFNSKTEIIGYKGNNSIKMYDINNNEITKTLDEGKIEWKNDIKSKCNSYTYKEVFRNNDNYVGKYAKWTGEVNQVLDSDNNSYFIMMSVTKDEWGYYDDSIAVALSKDTFDGRVLEDDIITVYGQIGDLYSYETILGETRTIPSLIAEFGELVK